MNNSQGRISTSLYETVREELRDQIESGIYGPGEIIPSTAALSEKFGVSPITIKRAIKDLQGIGLLTSIAGKGTFVKEQKRFVLALDAWSSPFADSTVKLLSITREKVEDPTLRLFDPPEGAMLCVRKLIFFGDGVPTVYDTTYLAADVDDETIDEFGKCLVADALRRRSVKILMTSHIVDALPAAGQAADVFGVPNGYPMLRRLYKLVTNRADVTIYGALQAPFDRLACTVNLAVEGREKHL